MALAADREFEEQRGPKIISRKETPLEQEYRRCLNVTYQIYDLKTEYFDSEIGKERVFTRAVSLLSTYHMDPAFLQHDPERGLLTLAIAEDLLKTSDEGEQEKLLLAFSFAADRFNSEDNFSYSARVHELYTADYENRQPIPLSVAQVDPEERQIIRLHPPTVIAKSGHEDLLVTDTLQVGDVKIKPLLTSLAHRLGINEEVISTIHIRLTNQNVMRRIHNIASVEHLPNGIHRITIGGMPDEHTLEHEGIHALLGGHFRRGYKGVLWFGIAEAGTEMLTTEPVTYLDQRLVLEQLFMNIDDPRLPEQFIDTLKGDFDARTDFLTTVIKHYGIEAYLQLALLNPGATHHVVHNMGKINRIFREPAEVAQFFVNPQR